MPWKRSLENTNFGEYLVNEGAKYHLCWEAGKVDDTIIGKWKIIQ